MDLEIRKQLLQSCAVAAARIWANYYACPKAEQKAYSQEIAEIETFTKKHFRLFGDASWSKKLRCGIFFTRYNSALSFRLAWLANRGFKRLNNLASGKRNRNNVQME